MAPEAQGMYAVLKDFQVLTASIVALGAAVIGFAGVWYAQKKSLENAEREREHREKMQEQERKLTQQRSRDTLINALSGELTALSVTLGNQMSSLTRQKDRWIELSKGDSGEKIQFNPSSFPQFDTLLFDRHIDRIGILDPGLVYATVRSYASLKGFALPSHFQGEIEVKMLAPLYEAAISVLDEIGKHVYDTVLRLTAVRLGHPDPGPEKGEEFWKYRDNPEQL